MGDQELGTLEVLRSQMADGTRPRQLLVTLFGDYWLDVDAMAPSGALVDLLQAMDVTQSGARTLLSRLSKSGRLRAVKEGRRTFYALSEQSRIRLTSGQRQIATFGIATEPRRVTWTTIAFSVPEDRRASRQVLRKGLSWLGFAPLYDGVWVTPRPVAQEAVALCRKVGVEAASLFEGSIAGLGLEHGAPTDAWDLTLARQYYEAFCGAAESIVERHEAGKLDPAAALHHRTSLINVWRAFPRFDPELPSGLLPEGWPRERARQAFLRAYDALGPAAIQFVRGAVERHSPERVGLVSGFNISTGERI